MESQVPEEVPLPIPAPLKAHMEDECFWILCRHKLLRLPRKPSVEDLLRQFYYHTVATPTEETSPGLLAEVLDGIKVYFDFTTEDHLLYGPEKEQFKLMIAEQLKNRLRAKSASQTEETQDNSASTTDNICNQIPGHLDHTPVAGNPWRSPPQQESQQKLQLVPAVTLAVSNTVLSEATAPLMPSQVYGAEHLLRLFLKFPLFLCRAQLPVTHVQLLHHHFKELLAYLCDRRGELFSEENYDSLEEEEEEEEQQGGPPGPGDGGGEGEMVAATTGEPQSPTVEGERQKTPSTNNTTMS